MGGGGEGGVKYLIHFHGVLYKKKKKKRKKKEGKGI